METILYGLIVRINRWILKRHVDSNRGRADWRRPNAGDSGCRGSLVAGKRDEAEQN